MYQLIIRNGRVLDPANGLDKVANVAIENGRIVGVNCFDGAEALQTVDATGCIVTPGLIDHHAHLYPMAAIGLPAEAVCFASGVTTAVDAGSTGCDTFADYETFLAQSKLRIRAYLNVCSIGLASLPHRMEDVDPAHFDEKAIRDTFDHFGDRSHYDYPNLTERQRANRALLRTAMTARGFVPISGEWWHFTLKGEPYPDTYFTFPVSSRTLSEQSTN